MNAVLLCVGKLREAYFADAAKEYEKRLSRFGSFEVTEVADQPEPKNASDADRRKVMDKEGEALLAHIKPNDFVTALCISARQVSSEELSALLKERETVARRQVFVIGGSLGLSEAVLRRADDRLSMSKMTFPHQLARVMLLEQLYRGCKIASGERYHK